MKNFVIKKIAYINKMLLNNFFTQLSEKQKDEITSSIERAKRIITKREIIDSKST